MSQFSVQCEGNYNKLLTTAMNVICVMVYGGLTIVVYLSADCAIFRGNYSITGQESRWLSHQHWRLIAIE